MDWFLFLMITLIIIACADMDGGRLRKENEKLKKEINELKEEAKLRGKE